MKFLRRVTMRGTIDTGTYNGNENKLTLFDGKFDTGWKVVSFEISPYSPTGAYEMIGKLSTEPKSNIAFFDFGDNEEIAWAGRIENANTFANELNFVDEENLLIEDLYISSYTTGEATQMNYLIRLEKYDITDWQGALAMVRNKSQG